MRRSGMAAVLAASAVLAGPASGPRVAFAAGVQEPAGHGVPVAYVSDSNSDTVTLISTATARVVKVVRVGPDPEGSRSGLAAGPPGWPITAAARSA
jgi:YVTN family beta-propeller protein